MPGMLKAKTTAISAARNAAKLASACQGSKPVLTAPLAAARPKPDPMAVPLLTRAVARLLR